MNRKYNDSEIIDLHSKGFTDNECESMKYKYDGCRKTPLNRETPIQDNPVLNL